MEIKNEIAIIDETTIKDKIYTIRDEQVMLDFELAEIYGYSTKDFNRQVRNNIQKFEGYMFQLTEYEVLEISRCKNSTSIMQGPGSDVLPPLIEVGASCSRNLAIPA